MANGLIAASCCQSEYEQLSFLWAKGVGVLVETTPNVVLWWFKHIIVAEILQAG